MRHRFENLTLEDYGYVVAGAPTPDEESDDERIPYYQFNWFVRFWGWLRSFLL